MLFRLNRRGRAVITEIDFSIISKINNIIICRLQLLEVLHNVIQESRFDENFKNVSRESFDDVSIIELLGCESSVNELNNFINHQFAQITDGLCNGGVGDALRDLIFMTTYELETQTSVRRKLMMPLFKVLDEKLLSVQYILFPDAKN
eukprot:UN27462